MVDAHSTWVKIGSAAGVVLAYGSTMDAAGAVTSSVEVMWAPRECARDEPETRL